MSRKCDITGKRAQFGNNVSHAQNKSKRQFKINMHNVTLRSDALDRDVKLRIAASTLRSIDHNGGLDNYLLKTANAKLTDEAIVLKRQIKKAVEATKAA